MIPIHRRLRPEQRLIHFDPPPHLHASHRIRRDRLIDKWQPRQRRWRPARTCLGHALRLDRPRRLKDRLVNFAHGVDGVLRRLVVMCRVIASGHAVNVVQLRPVKSPLADKSFRKLLVISLHLRHSRTQRRQPTRHPRVLAILIKNQPLRMLLHDFRDHVFMRLPLVLPIFHAQGQPPELRENSLLVKVVHHLLDRISGKCLLPRIPIPVSIEPAIIQRCPLDSQLLQLRHRPQHLRRRDVELVSPPAPAHVVRFVRRLGNLPSFFLQHT